MDNFIKRVLKRGHERVSAVLAMSVTASAIVWLSWSLHRNGHTETWNWAFASLLMAVVASYITGKVTALKEMSKRDDDGAAG